MASLIVPDPYADYPPRWGTFLDHREKVIRSHVFTRLPHVFRFGARYHLARAFRGLDLDGYTLPIKQGYEALTRAALHYSAFEGLLQATDKPRSTFMVDADPTACL